MFSFVVGFITGFVSFPLLLVFLMWATEKCEKGDKS